MTQVRLELEIRPQFKAFSNKFPIGTPHQPACDHQDQPVSSQPAAQHHDEFVLKCQFSALIPAFDPRPGKNNINQTQDILVPPVQPAVAEPAAEEPRQAGASPRVELYLRVETEANAGLEFRKDEVRLANKNATIFQYVQSLIAQQQPVDKMKNVWNMAYTLVYREAVDDGCERGETNEGEEEEASVAQVLQLLASLRRLVDSAELQADYGK